VEDGTVKIVFVSSAKIDADTCTKNTSLQLYEIHSAKYMVDEQMEMEDEESEGENQESFKSCNGKGVKTIVNLHNETWADIVGLKIQDQRYD
jgi:hypothetical protein